MASDFIPGARFRFLTPLYDGLCSLVGLGRKLRRFELSLLEGTAPHSVLEVGCGTGELLAGVAARFPGAEVMGLDADPVALAIAARKLEGRRLTVRLVHGRAESLPFRDASFDLVLSSLMLHHLPAASKVAALREWRRVLSPSGALLLVDFGRAHSWLPRAATWPLRPFEHVADNLRGRIPWMLEQAGFAYEEVGTYGAVVIAIRARSARDL